MREMGQKRNIPNISWNTSAFLIEKLRPRNIRNILEIGPANGFSTIILSLACPQAQITSLECSRHAFEELRQNLQTFNSLEEQKTEDRGQNNRFFPADFPPKVTSEINQQKIGQFSLYYGDAREVLPAFVR